MAPALLAGKSTASPWDGLLLSVNHKQRLLGLAAASGWSCFMVRRSSSLPSFCSSFNILLLFASEFFHSYPLLLPLFKYRWYEIRFICESVFWAPLYPAKVSTFSSLPQVEVVLDYQPCCLLSNKVRKDWKVTKHLYFSQIQEDKLPVKSGVWRVFLWLHLWNLPIRELHSWSGYCSQNLMPKPSPSQPLRGWSGYEPKRFRCSEFVVMPHMI